MRVRDVIGRKIIGIEQKRIYDSYASVPAVDVQAFLLDDGTRLVFHPSHTELFDYLAVAVQKDSEEHK